MRTKTLSLLAAMLCASVAVAVEPTWIGTWGASPLLPTAPNGLYVGSPRFANQTVRQIVRLSAGGQRVRLRLTNEYGDRPVTIGAASVAVAEHDSSVRAGSERQVTFGGSGEVTLAPGAALASDSIDLVVAPLTSLSVSLYFPLDTGPCTCHWTGRQAAFVSPPGNFTRTSFDPARTIEDRVFLSGIDVEAKGPTHVIVALGDSFTDGVGAMLNQNHRWPDYLAERLAARSRAGTWAVVNQGVSGGALGGDGVGENGPARFDRDVLGVAGVTHVIIALGIDEIGTTFGPSDNRTVARPEPGAAAESMIAAYRELVARAHAAGVKAYLATITPYENAGYYSDEGEAVRTKVNAWIRRNRDVDGVLDFDAAVRERDEPDRFIDTLQSGDHLHANDAGYRAIAESIDLRLFR